MRKVWKVKEVKIITYFFWRWLRHNYFTSLSISLNRKLRIISIQILILYEHLLSFTKSLRALGIYASLRNAELVRKEEALYLRFFTDELKIRKLWISCCAPKAMMKARRSKKRALLASLKWGEGWSRCSIYFVQDCMQAFNVTRQRQPVIRN